MIERTIVWHRPSDADEEEETYRFLIPGAILVDLHHFEYEEWNDSVNCWRLNLARPLLMAIYRYVSQEVERDGQIWLEIGPETEEVRCERCGKEASRQVCPGDGRYHHHGCVHTVDHELIAVCNECIAAIDREWTEKREAQPTS